MGKPCANGDDALGRKVEPVDESAAVAAIIEDKALLSTFITVLDRLTQDELTLWELLKIKAKKQEIADRFDLSLYAVRYREQRLFTKIRSVKTLRSFFSVD